MLAKRYEHHRKKLTYPLCVQPKLNGVRALYWDGQFQSRDEHYWNPGILDHLSQVIDIPPNVVLDGELYFHGWSLQKINSAVSVNRVDKAQHTSLVQYHIFDCIMTWDLDAPFSTRNAFLRKLRSAGHLGLSTSLVTTHTVHTSFEADHFYTTFLNLGYEGIMYRLDAPYGLEHLCSNKENRWPCLIKRKNWLDDDCEIVDCKEGTGKYVGMVGSLFCRFPENGKIFSAGSGLSDLQRAEYMDHPPIGQHAKIKYLMLSDEGTPLNPTIEAILD